MSFTEKNGHISCLHPETERKLCKQLNILQSLGQDYRTLASKLGIPCDDQALLERKSNPTGEILLLWKNKPGATVAKFIEILLEMDRLDCLDILKGDPLLDNRPEIIQEFVDVSQKEKQIVNASVEVSPVTRAMEGFYLALSRLKERIYNTLCYELNKTLTYFLYPLSTFSLLAEEMDYDMGEIKFFKKSTDPTNALLQDWGKRPGNGVIKLINLLKKIEKEDLARMLEKEVEEIQKRENLDVKPKRKAGPTGEGPKKKRKRKARKEGVIAP